MLNQMLKQNPAEPSALKIIGDGQRKLRDVWFILKTNIACQTRTFLRVAVRNMGDHYHAMFIVGVDEAIKIAVRESFDGGVVSRVTRSVGESVEGVGKALLITGTRGVQTDFRSIRQSCANSGYFHIHL